MEVSTRRQDTFVTAGTHERHAAPVYELTVAPIIKDASMRAAVGDSQSSTWRSVSGFLTEWAGLPARVSRQGSATDLSAAIGRNQVAVLIYSRYGPIAIRATGIHRSPFLRNQL